MRIGLAGTGRIGAFHAKTLTTLPGVDDLVLADLDTALAERVATDLGVGAAPSIAALLDSGLDAFVITAGTAAHAELLEAAIARGIPTFCEKPVALDLERTIALTELEATSGVPVHIGFQRRFDTGYRRVRDAVASGELGFVHTVRAATMDQAPPHAAYLPTSGGLFRDCSVHDFDILRFVTAGRSAGSSPRAPTRARSSSPRRATSTPRPPPSSSTTARWSRSPPPATTAPGTTCAWRCTARKGTLGVGHDTSWPSLRPSPASTGPPGPRHWSFMERFLPAYVTELTAFVDVARGVTPSPCTVADALEAFRTAEACARSMASGRAGRPRRHPHRSRRTVGSRLISPFDPRIPSPHPIWDTDPPLRTTRT